MALLKIIKLSSKTWKHNSDVDGDFILTKFYAKQEDNNFLLVESYGSKRRKYLINEIEVYDIGGSAETFSNFDDLFLRLEFLKYPAFYIDGEFTFNPASYDLTEFQNTNVNPFVRLDDIITKDIDTLPAATTPLAGTEPLIVLQDGTLKKVAASDLGGSSLRREKYHAVIGQNAFSANTLWYGMRNNVANTIFNPLWTTGLYNGSTNLVDDARIWGFPITFDQKVTKIIFNYEAITANTTFRVIYYENNPSGFSNNAINNQVIHDETIVNSGGVRQPLLIVTPTAFTMTAGGCLSVVVFNNNVASTVRTFGMWIETEEVI